jgi:hypothetical protein
MPVWVAITDAPVYMRERGGEGRGGSGGRGGRISGSTAFRTAVIRYTQKGVSQSAGRCARYIRRKPHVNCAAKGM